MIEKNVTWDEFKSLVSTHIKEKKGGRLCRGQANSVWKLQTRYHRENKNKITFKDYFEMAIPIIADYFSSIENRIVDTTNPTELASFISYLQHHGFPTPFLDWSLSPYIAAYFAFSTIDSHAPDSDHAAIYIFDYLQWVKDWEQVRDYSATDPHVTLIQPKAFGNGRQIRQQGLLYTFTNVDDIESHVTALEENKSKNYLEKYIISVKERPYIMTDLHTMGINAHTLFGDAEGLARYFRESLFMPDFVQETPSERLNSFLERFKNKT